MIFYITNCILNYGLSSYFVFKTASCIDFFSPSSNNFSKLWIWRYSHLNHDIIYFVRKDPSDFKQLHKLGLLPCKYRNSGSYFCSAMLIGPWVIWIDREYNLFQLKTFTFTVSTYVCTSNIVYIYQKSCHSTDRWLQWLNVEHLTEIAQTTLTMYSKFPSFYVEL